jgi:hypothetical protein
MGRRVGVLACGRLPGEDNGVSRSPVVTLAPGEPALLYGGAVLPIQFTDVTIVVLIVTANSDCVPTQH